MNTRFKTKDLLLFLGAMAFLSFFIGVFINNNREISFREKKAMERIHKMDCGVEVEVDDWRGYRGKVFRVTLHVRESNSDQIVLDILRHLKEFRQIDFYCAGTDITDRGLHKVKALSNLRKIVGK